MGGERRQRGPHLNLSGVPAAGSSLGTRRPGLTTFPSSWSGYVSSRSNEDMTGHPLKCRQPQR